MSGKYLKYEVRVTGRRMLILFGILAAATAFVNIVYLFTQKLQLGPAAQIFAQISIALYAVALMVVAVSAFIYPCYHFYQTMYSTQGYLTHTLPLTSAQILHAKILASFGLIFFIIAMCWLSIGITASVVLGNIRLCINAIHGLLTDFSMEMGKPIPICAAFFITYGFLAVLYLLLICYAGCSIGQLFAHAKGAYGIAAIIVLYYFSQIINVIVLVAGFTISYHISGEYSINWVLAAALAIWLFWIICYYVISRVIIQKHLNLE